MGRLRDLVEANMRRECALLQLRKTCSARRCDSLLLTVPRLAFSDVRQIDSHNLNLDSNQSDYMRWYLTSGLGGLVLALRHCMHNVSICCDALSRGLSEILTAKDIVALTGSICFRRIFLMHFVFAAKHLANSARYYFWMVIWRQEWVF